MRFKKIKIRNIRSYKQQEIEFPRGSLLLSGDVGVGKTSILLAIEYAFFGLQPGQKGNSLLRNNKDVGEVSLEMEIGGKRVIIDRKLKRTNKGVSNEYAALTVDNERFESSVTEIKSKIVDLLGYPREFVKKNNLLYGYTVYSPQEKMKEIILEDSETRLNILRHIFGVDKYKRIKGNLDIFMNNLRSDNKILQGEIKTLEQDKEYLKRKKTSLTEIEKRTKEIELNLIEKIEAKEKKENELAQFKDKNMERTALEKEMEKNKVMILNKRELLSSLISESAEIRRAISEVKDGFSESNYNSIINEANNKKNELELLNSLFFEATSRINYLAEEEGNFLKKKERIFKIDICPTCLQDVPEAHKHNILNETENKIQEIKNTLEKFKIQKEKILGGIKNIRLAIDNLEEEKIKLEILKTRLEYAEKSRDKLKELEKNRENIEKDIVLLAAHSVGIKEKLLEFSQFDSLYKKKEIELKQAVQEEKREEIALAELKKELELIKKEIIFLEDGIKNKEERKKKLEERRELIDWLSSEFLSIVDIIERNVLLKLRAEFSNLFRKWFQMLVPENSLESQIDDNFTPIIMQGEAEIDYEFLSGGERTAVALAYRLALNQLINSLLSKIETKGVIILDEPTDGFSEIQINKMREIFAEIKAEQLIIVSHEQKIEGFVDNVLKVAKENGQSFIENVS
ncbi:AAA family ATPase [Candidatus Pacearchaeota archaeon]|nr:AAA family ATPase [Candidatus Pacearchaeota archaeon]